MKKSSVFWYKTTIVFEVFGNAIVDLDSIKEKITGIINGLDVLKSYPSILKTLKNYDIKLSGLNSQEISSLQKYINLLNEGKPKSYAFTTALTGASDATKLQAKQLTQLNLDYKHGIVSESEYVAATQNLIAVQKTATLSSKALSLGLKTLGNLAFMVAINAFVSGISKLVSAFKEYEQKQEEIKHQAEEMAESYKTEKESLDDLLDRYSSVISSTESLESKEKSLLSLQSQIIDKYGEKADSLDLVHQKYSQVIEDIQKMKLEEAEEYIEKSDRTSAYADAKYALQNKEAISFDMKLSDETKKSLQSINNILWFNGNKFNVSGTLEERRDTLKEIVLLYKQQDSYSRRKVEKINEEIDKLDKEIKRNQKIVTQYEAAVKIRDEIKIPEDVQQSFDNLLDKAIELGNEFSGENTSAVRKYAISQELSDVKNELNNIAGSNSNLRDIIRTTFSTFDSGVLTSIEAVGDLRTAWFESLSEMQKGSLKNIDTMKSALQTIMNGEGLSKDVFWQLAEFDTDHILDGVKMIGDKFYLTESQIVSLKDSYIQKEIETIKLRQSELQILKQSAELEAKQAQASLDSWVFAEKNLNNPKYRAEFEDLQQRVLTAKENAEAYGDEWSLNAILLRQYNASLGNTADLIQAAQSQAEKLSEAFVGRIDKVINGINDQKDALTEEKEVLQDQLDVLEAQADEIKGIIEDYEKVADIVKETIEEEISAIEETYNKQIEALKAQNEEREEAINLTEKLNNLNNAKNNKVITYTEAGGFQYGVNKEAVNKAQQEYDKALIDSQIAKLEKERDSATAGFEEYAKLWENATKKATKAEEEELAARILGADWREKISEQDVEIFETYEQKYDEYGVSLNNITNIEIANVKKSIEAKDKEIKAKEDLLKEWQKYKTNVQNYVNDLKNTNKEYEDSIENITLTENSNLDERLANFKRFKGEYESMINRILELQDGVGDIEVNASVKMDDFTDGIKEVVEGIGTVSEKLAEAIKELGKMPSINSAGDVKYYQATGYQHYASGGVNSSTGLAWLDGTRSKPELVLNNQDATKLYNLLHSMPVSDAQMFSSPLTRFAGLKSSNTSQSSAITITGNTINLPNVRDPQQFAREMERYLQTTLTESQIIPPRS